MKLYELKTGSKFKFTEEPLTPPDALEGVVQALYTKTRPVDGMYVPCKDQLDREYFFAAWTEVEEVK